MRGVALLGCTGSIGQSALRVLARHREEFRVVALAAHRSGSELAALCRTYHPSLAVLVDSASVNGTSFEGVRLETGRDALLFTLPVTYWFLRLVLPSAVGA